MIAALEKGTAGEKLQAARELRQRGAVDREDVRRLARVLDREYGEVRYDILRVLGGMAEAAAPAVPAVLRVVAEADVKDSVAIDVCKSVGTEALPYLRAALKLENVDGVEPGERAGAVRVLAKTPELGRYLVSELSALLTRELLEWDPFLPEAIGGACAALGDADTLVRAGRSSSAEVRRVAATACALRANMRETIDYPEFCVEGEMEGRHASSTDEQRRVGPGDEGRRA